ncbi:MAG: tyrosine-type recombinase/integrase [Thermoplasmata archaeon]
MKEDARAVVHQASDDNIESFVVDFLGDCRLRGMTHYSVLSYSSALRSFRRHLDHLGISSVLKIDKNAIRDYIREIREVRKLSISTIENHLSCISALLDYLVYEDIIESNVALQVRKRYVRRYKAESPCDSHSRKLITVEQLKVLVDSILNPRDKAIVVLLAKTGIRRGELVSIDVSDIDFVGMKLTLKPKAKRSNRIVFIDEECVRALQEWLDVRVRYARKGEDGLFITVSGGRVSRNAVYEIVTGHAKRVGLHNHHSKRLEDHFTPHCLRHWFTTYLRRSGMPREMVQELRGDVRGGAIDIYYHIDEEQLRNQYLQHIPKLGIR